MTSEQPSDGAPAQPAVDAVSHETKQQSGRRFTTRQIVWGTMAVLAIPALWEICAQYGSLFTGEDWRDAYQQVDHSRGDMHKSALDQFIWGLPSLGFPSVTETDARELAPLWKLSDNINSAVEFDESIDEQLPELARAARLAEERDALLEKMEASELPEQIRELSLAQKQEALARAEELRPSTAFEPVTKSIATYTWPGVVRTFKIHVYLGLGADPTVEDIVGPAEVGERLPVQYIDEPPPEEDPLVPLDPEELTD